MLSSVEIRTSRGGVLTLPLQDVSDGLVLAEVQGLDPVKATLVSSSFAGADGEQYHSSRREARNITLKLDLEPDYVTTSVSDLRNRLYTYLMPKSEVTLGFYMSNGLYTEIVGRVESLESPQFTQEPAADISLTCFDPDFIDPVPVHLDLMSTDLTTETLIPYLGTVDTGVVFTLLPDRALSQFTIYHRPPDGTFRQLDFVTALSAGDKLVISTVPGAKGATLTSAGTTKSVLYGVSPQSNWHALQNGDNYFRVYATGAPIPFDIDYITRYGGL